MRVRAAGRVIVLDPEDRVLLFRYDDGPPNGRHWCTPGGGLIEGEGYLEGARRELAEETGWTDVPLSGEVYRQTRTMEYEDEIVRQHERFFVGRTEPARRALGEDDGLTAMHASDGIAAWRWWTLAEMDATDEVIWPSGLAGLVRSLLGLIDGAEARLGLFPPGPTGGGLGGGGRLGARGRGGPGRNGGRGGPGRHGRLGAHGGRGGGGR